MARFVDELFPDAELDGFMGTLIGEAQDGRFTVVAMDLGRQSSDFASLEVTPIP